MRFFCFILSAYILLLSLVPCREMAEIAESFGQEISQQTQIQNPAQTDENGDHCSPFCICSCCHFSTVFQFNTFSVTGKTTASAISRPDYSYQNPYSQTYQNPIWQPPKFNSIG
jgi:hypothetical protein